MLKGQVIDDDGKPIPDVNVILYGGIATRLRGQQTKTNNNGDYEFKPLNTGAMTSIDEGGSEWYTGVEFKHPKFVPADGKSWRDISVPNEKDYQEVLDLKMTRGGKIRATVIDSESKKPIPNLDLRIYNGVIDGKETGDYLVYAKTDANGRFTSEPLFPGHYVIDINDNNYQGKYRYPRIGQADVRASETTVLRLEAHELREFQITGTAVGDDGKSMVYGGVGVRLLGEDAKLRTRGGGIDGRNVFGLVFAPVKRGEPSPEAPYGIGTHDIELVGSNDRYGYKLVKRTPSEPLRITDNPNQPELESGIRYIRPNQPVEFKLVFAEEK